MRLFAGASGYSFKEWKGPFYPADMKADGNEVAVETIEIAHEGLTIANS